MTKGNQNKDKLDRRLVALITDSACSVSGSIGLFNPDNSPCEKRTEAQSSNAHLNSKVSATEAENVLAVECSIQAIKNRSLKLCESGYLYTVMLPEFYLPSPHQNTERTAGLDLKFSKIARSCSVHCQFF